MEFDAALNLKHTKVTLTLAGGGGTQKLNFSVESSVDTVLVKRTVIPCFWMASLSLGKATLCPKALESLRQELGAGLSSDG